MKKDQIKIGGLYTAKVSDRMVTVRIDSVSSHGGWNATNTATGKAIRIKGAQRLRRAAGSPQDASGASQGEPKAKTRAKSAREPKPKKTSALDAAAQVLAKASEPMGAQDLITAIAEKGLWKSPGGKTPHATLYAAIVREIGTKGKEARFKKVERGLFAINEGSK